MSDGFHVPMPKQTDVLARELAKAERRYASLIPLLVHTEDEAVSSCLNWQAEEMGIGSWREHFGKPMAEALRSGAKLQNDQAEASGARGRPIANQDAPAALPPAHG